jgi:hypothetical protein
MSTAVVYGLDDDDEDDVGDEDDAKTKTQFRHGKCPVCVCRCHFVCHKE